MTKIYEIFSKNRILSALVTFIIIGSIAFFVMESLAWGITIKVILLFLIAIISFLLPVTFANRLMSEKIQEMDESCNPTTLIQFCEEYKNKPLGANFEIVRCINEAAAKSYIGQLDEAWECLLKLNPELLQLKNPVMAYLTYNNMASIKIKQNLLDEAATLIKNASDTIKIIQANQQSAQKSSVSKRIMDALEKNRIELELAKLENGAETESLDSLLSRANALEPTKPIFVLQVKFILGKIYFLQNETEKAIENLDKVINRGKDLAIAVEAQALRAQC